MHERFAWEVDTYPWGCAMSQFYFRIILRLTWREHFIFSILFSWYATEYHLYTSTTKNWSVKGDFGVSRDPRATDNFSRYKYIPRSKAYESSTSRFTSSLSYISKVEILNKVREVPCTNSTCDMLIQVDTIKSSAKSLRDGNVSATNSRATITLSIWSSLPPNVLSPQLPSQFYGKN